MKKTILSASIWLGFALTNAQAQMPTQDAEQLNMSNVLLYFFPFYLITFTVLSFFIYWLLKPSKGLRNAIVGLALLGSVGALVLNQQLPKWQGKTEEGQEPETASTQTFKQNIEALSGFWVIALPNLIVLTLTLGIGAIKRRA
jgi:hypothetical protein